VMLAGMMSLPIVGALVRSAGGIEAFLAQGRDGYSAWRAGYGDAAEVPLRVDAAAVIARVTGYGLGSAGELLVAAALVALGAVLIRRLRPTETNDRGPASAGIASLVMVLAVYRQPYDLLLLVLPLTALTAVISRRGGVREAPSHALVLGLLLIPMANYFTFGAGASLLGLTDAWRVAAASLNGVVVVLALLAWSVIVLRWTADVSVRVRPWPRGAKRPAQASGGGTGRVGGR
jgi:hypothetical protein